VTGRRERAVPFEPRVALSSLSGRSDADWARAVSEHVGAAILGGIALDGPTREAARELVDRDRVEFLPPDPLTFLDDQLGRMDSIDCRAGFNVRSVSAGPLVEAAEICRDYGAILEINAHCRQAEMCAAGCGEGLLADRERLERYVGLAAATGATVSVKLRAEVPGVDLPSLAAGLVEEGASVLHVDAMDSEPVVGAIDDRTDAFLIANNGVRDGPTVREYLDYGADAVSVGRPSDDPAVLSRVRSAVGSRVGTGAGAVDSPEGQP